MPQPPPAARAAAKTAAAAAAATATATRATAARRAGGPRPRPTLPAAEIAATKQKSRRIIWTVAFAAVTFTGTIYGAGLKTQQEWSAEKQKVEEATVDEKVALLEQHKLGLMRQKNEIEGKLEDLRERMKAAAAAAAAAEGGR
ncbi:hypothetical protein C8A00DRAFT_43412 [Chaetomidium leptoderma]|uniref:Uncharacterized protein n=1 Tax=Chaetomidium leptoderma TaxID=669021 RepID=A0AAN6VMX0_9PEZI|nr:hypothetical protein C8A00DRAFT_43412 [Chaetomidium leptoderma]